MYKFTRWSPLDRSGKVCWLLNELAVPFEVQELESSEQRHTPEYRKLHPLGLVPALQDLRNGINVFESGAICLYLADLHKENGLLPPDPKNRALCYQWSTFNFATLEPAIAVYWDLDDKDPAFAAKKAEVDKKVIPLLKPIEEALSGAAFICGDQFSVADIAIGQAVFWVGRRPFMKDFPLAMAYLERMKSRPAAQKAGLFAEQA